MAARDRVRSLFRIWIVRCQGWRPEAWSDVPPEAVAVEPAEEEPLTAAEVDPYLEGFNRSQIAESDGRWAIAVPVEVKFEGDLRRGEPIRPSRRTA